MLRSSFNSLRPGGWFRAIGYSALTVTVFIGFSSLIVGLLFWLISSSISIDESLLEEPSVVLSINVLSYAISLGGLWYFSKVYQTMDRTSLQELFGISRLPRWSDIGVALLGFLAYFPLSIIVQIIADAFIPGFNIEQTQDIGFENLVSIPSLVIAGLALVVFAPLAEELVFRGFLFGNLKRELRFIPAALITSILFGYVHGQWNVGLDVFVLSLALCYLRLKTDAIWASVFLHSIKNSLAFFLLFIAPLLGINLL